MPEKTEEHQVSSGDLLAKLKEIIHEGNVRHVMVKDGAGKKVLEIPLSVGIVGLVLVPFLAAIAALAAVAADYTIVVVKEE